MRFVRLVFLLCSVLSMPCSGFGAQTNQSVLVYIVPVREMIEPALVYVLRRQIEEGEEADADAFVFTMDTPGGAVGAAEEIIELISDIEAPTYTFVERSAISAGALIAIATDHIYMAPGSKIGDAMPYQGNPMGGAAETPERMNEKMESYVAGLARSAAQRSGHNPEVAMAMVRPDYELKIGEEVISPKGQLLTLTNVEAEKKYGEDNQPLLSAGTIESQEKLLEHLGYAGAETVTTQITTMERIGRLIPPIAPILLMAGLLGIYVEIKTPGLGIPGLLGGICLIVFFWGHHIAGLAGMEDVVIFGIGVVLLMLEIFVIPGFGIAGILGILCMLGGIFMAMVQHYPGGPPVPTLPKLQVPIRNMAVAIVGTALGGILLGRFLPKTTFFKKLSLEESTTQDKGYTSTNPLEEYIGQEGKTTSPLRPSGTAFFGDTRLDVITDGEFLGPDTKVKVVSIKGNHIFVEALENPDNS